MNSNEFYAGVKLWLLAAAGTVVIGAIFFVLLVIWAMLAA